VNRIAAETGMPGLFSTLAEKLSPTDLQSLLLSVYKSRANGLRESVILTRAERAPLFAPSDVDARLLHGFDRAAFSAAGSFEAVELSPVCPFGTEQVLGAIGQDNVLTAIRNAEVLGDSTPTLALECARRRHRHRTFEPVRLCASHRLLRLQPVDFPGFSPHFRLFGLVTAGRDTGSSSFEIQHLAEHLRFYLRLFRALNTEGFHLANPLVELSDLTITEALLSSAGISRDQVRQAVRAHKPGSAERFLAGQNVHLPADVKDLSQHARLSLLKQRVVDPLQADFPEASFRFNLARLEGLGYYTGLCLRISPQAPDGLRYPVADGGFTDWTARLLEDRKERLLISGIGSEFVCRRYREPKG
jgi:hypothetical protein